MTRVLLLSFSPHGKDARSFELAREVITQSLPNAVVVERDYGSTPPPPLSRDYAKALTTRGPVDPGAVDFSERLIGEVEASDVLILCTPLHNFTVPATLKSWIDHVVRINRTFNVNDKLEKIGVLEDRPTFVLVSSGGVVKGQPFHQADFLSPYLRVILGTVGIHAVEFLYLESLLRGEAALSESLSRVRSQLSDRLRFVR